MKYRIIIVIIIIISLGEILLSDIANTSHVGAPKHYEVNDPPLLDGSWVIDKNTRVATRFPRGFARFSRIKNC